MALTGVDIRGTTEATTAELVNAFDTLFAVLVGDTGTTDEWKKLSWDTLLDGVVEIRATPPPTSRTAGDAPIVFDAVAGHLWVRPADGVSAPKAIVASGSIGPDHITDNSITPTELDTLTSALADTAKQLAFRQRIDAAKTDVVTSEVEGYARQGTSDTITLARIADGSITKAKLAADAQPTPYLVSGTVASTAAAIITLVQNEGNAIQVTGLGDAIRAIAGSASNTAIDGRLDDKIEKAALKDEALTEADKAAWRGRVESAKEGEHDYFTKDLGGYNYFGSPRRDTAEDTGVVIPAGAVRLRISPLNDGNYDEIEVATLLALPNVSAGDTTNDTNSINLFEESDFRLGHNGRDIYFVNASVQGPQETVDFKADILNLEPYADRATPTAQIPASRLPPSHASVNADWDQSDPTNAAYIENKPDILEPDTLPEGKASNADQDVVLEDLDLVLALAAHSTEWRYSTNFGSIVDRQGLASDATITSVVRALRYTPATRAFEVWLTTGTSWSHLWLEGNRYDMGAATLEGVPWIAGDANRSHFTITLPSDSALDLTDDHSQIRFNLEDPDGDPRMFAMPRLRFSHVKRESQSVRSVRALPGTAEVGQRYLLLEEQDNVADVAVVKPVAASFGINVPLPIEGRRADIDLISYRNAGTTPSGSARRLNVDVNTTITSRTPSKIIINGQSYALRSDGTGGYISTDTFATASDSPLLIGIEQGLNVEFTDGTLWFPNVTLPEGEYFWDGFAWRPTAPNPDAHIDARIAPWARKGDTETVPGPKIPDLPGARIQFAIYSALPAITGVKTGTTIYLRSSNEIHQYVATDPTFTAGVAATTWTRVT